MKWIEDAGIISRCYNLELPDLPLDGNAISDIFKVYMNDTGLFVKMGRKLYYYHKDSGLEIDFVTRYQGGCYLVEVKSTTGMPKALKQFYHIQKNTM